MYRNRHNDTQNITGLNRYCGIVTISHCVTLAPIIFFSLKIDYDQLVVREFVLCLHINCVNMFCKTIFNTKILRVVKIIHFKYIILVK